MLHCYRNRFAPVFILSFIAAGVTEVEATTSCVAVRKSLTSRSKFFVWKIQGVCFSEDDSRCPAETMELRLTLILILVLLPFISELDQTVEAIAAKKKSRSSEVGKSINSQKQQQGKVNSKIFPTESKKMVALKKSKTAKSGKNASLKKEKEVSW